MTHKTMEEQEREAYITGHVHMADLLARAMDNADVEEGYDERITELDDTIIDLENKVSDLDAEIDELKEKLADYE